MAMVRVGTFNILHGMDVSDGVSEPDRLRAAVDALDADVLALQEVDLAQPRSGGCDQTAVAAAALGARWSRFEPTVLGTPGVAGWRPAAAPGAVELTADVAESAGSAPGPAVATDVAARSYGIALVSRLPVRRWLVQRFPAAPGRLPLLVPGRGRSRLLLVPDEPRAALAAVVDGPHGPFTVVATHLTFVPGVNVSQLRRTARWAAGLPQPVFLVGDLNLPGRIPARVTRWRSLASGPTYPAQWPRVQLDHVLAVGLPDDAVRSQHVWATKVSDHRPVSVDVDL